MTFSFYTLPYQLTPKMERSRAPRIVGLDVVLWGLLGKVEGGLSKGLEDFFKKEMPTR